VAGSPRITGRSGPDGSRSGACISSSHRGFGLRLRGTQHYSLFRMHAASYTEGQHERRLKGIQQSKSMKLLLYVAGRGEAAEVGIIARTIAWPVSWGVCEPTCLSSSLDEPRRGNWKRLAHGTGSYRNGRGYAASSRRASCSLGAPLLCQLPSAVTHRESDGRRGVPKPPQGRRHGGCWSGRHDSKPLRVALLVASATSDDETGTFVRIQMKRSK